MSKDFSPVNVFFYVPELGFFFFPWPFLAFFMRNEEVLSARKVSEEILIINNSSQISLVSYFCLISFRHVSKFCILQTTFSLLFICQQYCIVQYI